jgi:hypothetical protein
VCHLANSVDIIETILLNAYASLDKHEIFDFSKHIDLFIDAQIIIDRIMVPENIGSNSDVERNKEKRLVQMDKAGILDGDIKSLDDSINDKVSDKERDLAAITASVKIMDVLGQILLNYPGDIDGNMKIEIISEVCNLGMRVINALISTVGLIEEDLILFLIEKAKEENMNYSRGEIADRTRTFLSVIYATITRGVIYRIASSLRSDYLLPALTETFEKDDSISKKLILQEIKFNYLRTPNISEAIRILDEISSMNATFALSILQSTVGNYLIYNMCDNKTREKLSDTFNFDKRKALVEFEKQKKIQ